MLDDLETQLKDYKKEPEERQIGKFQIREKNLRTSRNYQRYPAV